MERRKAMNMVPQVDIEDIPEMNDECNDE